MSELQPITVYVHSGGPNPYKVTIVLEELNIPYKKIVNDNPKEDWFVAINPNGRVPAIIDPNNDNLTLWESGAIVEYLIDTYDKAGKLTAASAASNWHLKQYLHFQMSGQGPYYGQAVWFQRCPEDMPTAKTRYLNETERVMMVLDNILKGKEYLVDNKLTYADLSFVPWNRVAQNAPFLRGVLWEGHEIEKKYPNFAAWHKRLCELESVKKAYA